MRTLFISSAFLLLAACAGSEKGTDVGVGFDTMDTESKESKDKEKWFDSYYGEERCTWNSTCPNQATDSPYGW